MGGKVPQHQEQGTIGRGAEECIVSCILPLCPFAWLSPIHESRRQGNRFTCHRLSLQNQNQHHHQWWLLQHRHVLYPGTELSASDPHYSSSAGGGCQDTKLYDASWQYATCLSPLIQGTSDGYRDIKSHVMRSGAVLLILDPLCSPNTSHPDASSSVLFHGAVLSTYETHCSINT